MKSVILGLMLLIFFGCSRQKTTAKLEIALGFASTNSSFDGGLFIHGKNSASGEEFSFALAAQTSTSIDLNYGVWDIRIVGWDNTANLFEGDVLCASEKIDFKKEEQRVAIQVTNAKCNNAVFAGTDFITNNSGQITFAALDVQTCGALYDTTNVTQLAPAGTPRSCNSYPKEFQKQAKGISYTLHNKLPNGQLTAGLTSGCIAQSAGTFVTSKRLPTKIPITINFFDGQDCLGTSSLGKLHFPQGIENNLSRVEQGHDAILHPTAKVLQLALPISKRGTTPFLTERPFLSCNSNLPQKCMQLPLLPTGFDFVFKSGQTYTIRFPAALNCNSLSFTSDDLDSNGDGEILYDGYCENVGNETLLGIQVAQHAASVSISLNIDGQTYTGLIDQNPYAVYEHIVPYLGFNKMPGDISGSIYQSNKDEDDDKAEGILGNISELLSPIYAGGLFWDTTCTSAPLPTPVTRSVAKWEDGEEKIFTVTLTNPPNINTPRYINSSNPKSTTDVKTFHRRLILREFMGSAVGYKTTNIMDLACDGLDALDITSGNANLRIGRLEEFHDEFDFNDSERRIERKLIYWNTNSLSESRFEVYQHDYLENTLYNKVIREKTSFARVEKLPNATSFESALRLTELSYHYHLNGAQTIADSSDDSHFEEVKHKQFDILNDQFTLLDMGEIALGTGYGHVFNGSMFLHEKNRIRYGVQNVDNRVISLPDGKFLHAYVPDLSTNLVIDRFDGTSYMSHTVADSNIIQVTPDLSPDGTKAIVAATTNSGITLNLFNGTNWIKNTISFPQGVSTINAAILNNGEYMIALTNLNGKIYYALGNMTNFPGSLTQTTFHAESNSISNIFLTKDNNKFWFFHDNERYVSPDYINELTLCTLSYSGQTCNLSTLASWTGYNPPGWSFTNLSAKTSPDNSTITYSYVNNLTNANKSFTSSTTGTPTWTVVDSYVANIFIVDSISIQDFDMTNYNVSGANTRVHVPYVQPIIPSFQMNFISLKPSNMISNVFTNKTTFENTAN